MSKMLYLLMILIKKTKVNKDAM